MIRKIFLVVCGLFLTSSAFAGEQRYKISFDVTHAGKEVASPTVIVKEGGTGSMELSGANGYRLSFVVTDAGNGKIKIAADFTSQNGISSPTIIIRDGQLGSVSDGEYEFRFVASRHGS